MLFRSSIRVIPPDSVATLKGKQANFVLTLAIKDVNKPVNIEAPKDAQRIEGFMKEIEGASPTSGAAPAEAGKPKYGGVLNSFRPGPVDDINIRGSSCAISNTHQPVWEGLLRWDPGFVSRPARSSSPEIQ